MDRGVEPLENAADRDALRDRARQVRRRALTAAALLTGLALLLP